MPLILSASFGYPDLEEWLDVAQGRRAGHNYSRNTNPTVAVFEEKVRLLEEAEAATSFSSGMAAISNTFFALLRPGDRERVNIIAVDGFDPHGEDLLELGHRAYDTREHA